MGRNPFSIKIGVAGEGGGAEGICNYYFRDLLVENGFPSPVTKHIVCLLYMTCGSSEHCKPLLAYVSVLFHLS